MVAALRRVLACVALLITAVLLQFAPAAAAPADGEGGSKSLRDALESAAKGHIEATQRLNASKKRQKALQSTLLQAQVSVRQLELEVSALASRSYRMGRFGPLHLLLDSKTPAGFLDRARNLDAMARLDGKALARYRMALDTAARAKLAIDREIAEQQKQVTVLARKKKEAEAALAAAGGGQTSVGFVNASSPLAKAAPRNSDGSWPSERCSVDDPTSDGCITPRLLHAYQEARLAGFKRYTGCYSKRASGEHPKGRACDFSAAAGGFENVNASGGDKAYGDRLAAYFVKNASRLGVLYVIWYRQIWHPGTGWKSYSGSGGPAATHTNHVHLSMI